MSNLTEETASAESRATAARGETASLPSSTDATPLAAGTTIRGITGTNPTPSGSREVGLLIEVSSQTGIGLNATSAQGAAISGQGKGAGVIGSSKGAVGVFGQSTNAAGVYGTSTAQAGVFGSSETGAGVEGISTSGPALFGLSSEGVALKAVGYVQIQSDAVGQATLPQGQTTVTVNTGAVTTVSNILLTPLADPQGRLWVTRDQGSFTIHASQAPGGDIAIAYLIVN